ncbi:hypothetical protein [Azotobacter chroococcum]|uniref:hypothetical protein n=1 Tax=Azotobacter chroococcum TaxID=353 RepID=UPI0010AECCD2|nr:hypothetical protein [Azotobacter chroococcum]TKD46652.1 hypothetical protein FCG41_01540 [Azotobacter chroococcum]
MAPKITLRFRVLRDGVVTPGQKLIRIYRDWNTTYKLDLAFWAEDGEWTQVEALDMATLVNQGEWLVTGYDGQSPRRTRASYMTFSETADITFNITNDVGAVGEPGTVEAHVKVDQAEASREVVVLERPVDGQWRVAGYGSTPDGVGTIDVRVTGGLYYAMALDDWGIPYQPNFEVSVGQTIRPTTFAGWLYRITEAGSLPATEPDWWDGNLTGPQDLGSARAEVVRYHRPLAHGPVPVETI